MGDTLIAKIFIKEIIKQLPGKRTAISNNYSYDYVKDIVDEHIPISSLFDRFDSNGKCREAFIQNDILYFNTWFAPPCIQPSDDTEYNKFRDPIKINNIVYNFDLHLKCFEVLVDNFNKSNNTNINITYIRKNKKNYLLDLYDENIDLTILPFFENKDKKKILVFNQIATSGQSDNGNYEPGIQYVLENENIVVYTSLPTGITHPRLVNLKNYFSEPDLFKAAKLSTFCDFICGPSNATVISTWVKQNLLRPNLEYIVVNRNDIGEATLLSDLDCKTTVVNSVSDLFKKLGEKLNG